MLTMRVTQTSTSRIRVGIVTSKRLGKAVRRNRARRLVRAGVRRICPRLRTGLDLVLVARPGILGVKAQQVEADLVNLATRAQILERPPEDRTSAGGSVF
jgi:ribonuclease P protein component